MVRKWDLRLRELPCEYILLQKGKGHLTLFSLSLPLLDCDSVPLDMTVVAATLRSVFKRMEDVECC